MRFLSSITLVWLVFSSLVSCQTSRGVSIAYQNATFGGDRFKPSNQTSVLFLVDGLSSEILKTSLINSNVPNIANAFTLSTKARFSLGRAVFPSLTFPNITSILAGTSNAQHPITGNRTLIDGQVFNFENTSSWNDLARLIHRRTVFAQLAAHDQSSVSYSYAFSGGATAFQDRSLEAGVAYLEKDYGSIDLATIVSLKSLLTETQVSKWPRFIFVHLIGVDAIAHQSGPLDPSIQQYLHLIDAELGPIFSMLDHPNGLSSVSREVNYAMTADHGFRTTPDHSPLADVVSRLKKRVRLIADNRVAPLFIEEEMSQEQRLELARSLLQVPHVGWAAVKSESTIDLFRRTGEHAQITFASSNCPNGQRAAHFEWLREDIDDHAEFASRTPLAFNCLSQFDSATGPDDDSYIVPALADYFAGPNAPDMVFIPDDHSDFAEGYAGNHGGLSREEMLVPVLTHGLDLPRGIHPTYELLHTMGVP